MADSTCQVLVVGGGIVGAGVARDAAMRGMSVRLVEQQDFAFGTSSRSSRLLHGGLRYLAQGRIGLVREAGREKAILQRIAPHLYHPVTFLFPSRKGAGMPRWKLGLGVRLYHVLCGGARPQVFSRSQLLDSQPNLDPSIAWTGGVTYADTLTNDARLVLDTLRSAEAAGASLENYTELVSAKHDGVTWVCQLRSNPVAADATHEATTRTVRAQCVVNATGPWSSQLPHSRTQLRITKGVHMVVAHDRLPVQFAVVMTQGDRILFAIPWSDRVIIGTTDTDYNGPLGAPQCTEVDLQYLLSVVNEHFQAALTVDDVTSTWAGLRPLLQSKGRPSEVSRRHQILEGEHGWMDVAGGKLTTYRLMAEQTVDRIARRLGRTFLACQTAKIPLLETPDASLESQFSGWQPPPHSDEAVAHYCRHEWTRSLTDLMVRRSAWHSYCPDRLDIAKRSLKSMASLEKWSDARAESEWSQYVSLVESEIPGQSSNAAKGWPLR